jgi:hypothetical protein
MCPLTVTDALAPMKRKTTEIQMVTSELEAHKRLKTSQLVEIIDELSEMQQVGNQQLDS